MCFDPGTRHGAPVLALSGVTEHRRGKRVSMVALLIVLLAVVIVLGAVVLAVSIDSDRRGAARAR